MIKILGREFTKTQVFVWAGLLTVTLSAYGLCNRCVLCVFTFFFGIILMFEAMHD
jgi:hypothetical protein